MIQIDREHDITHDRLFASSLIVDPPAMLQQYERVVMEIRGSTPTIRRCGDWEEPMACMPHRDDFRIDDQGTIKVPEFWYMALVARYNAMQGKYSGL